MQLRSTTTEIELQRQYDNSKKNSEGAIECKMQPRKCLLCLQDKNDIAEASPCGHELCMSCADDWFNVNTKCPFCCVEVEKLRNNFKTCITDFLCFQERVIGLPRLRLKATKNNCVDDLATKCSKLDINL